MPLANSEIAAGSSQQRVALHHLGTLKAAQINAGLGGPARCGPFPTASHNPQAHVMQVTDEQSWHAAHLD